MSVAIDGNFAIVGAPGKFDNTGAIYVYERSGSNWSQHSILYASTAMPGDDFGGSVDISSSYIIGGAKKTMINDQQNIGKAYAFHFDGGFWIEEYSFEASDGNEDDYFGTHVSISGNNAVIGAPGHEGKAYVFNRRNTNWSENAVLKAANPQAYDSFGQAVAISENQIIVGAPKVDHEINDFNNSNIQDEGKVYFFSKN
jgi:hypothetical protein